ncbi:MAG: Gfo/Idh/MocA family oxidoreductase [Clostridia bacterium]|nr:Gfo/Idh/MocA family oxidoreductase [Clostridia bacterium]
MKNACVVGYGNIGSVHAQLLEDAPYARLVAVCDIDEAKTAALCGKKVYNDYADALRDGEVDVVHICTPHFLHVTMALAALEAGKKVVLEKPAAIDEAQWRQLRAAKGAKDVCCVLQNRYNPCVEKLLSICPDVRSIFAALTWKRDAEYYASAPWRGKWATEGGGVVINQAVHLLDLMLLFGGEAASVCATISNKSMPSIEVEDTCDALIEFESGARGVFFATNTYPTNSPMRLEIETDDALYRYSDGALYRLCKGEASVLAKDTAGVLGKPYWGSGHNKLFEDYYTYLETGNGHFVSLEDARRVTELTHALYKSAGERILLAPGGKRI